METPAIRRKVGDKWVWQYTEAAANELSELKLRHGKWRKVAKLLGVTEGSLSVYASNLRKKGFTVGKVAEAEPVRNREVGAEESPLAEVELVKLQRQRIAVLEEALWQVESIIAKVLAS